MNSSTYSGVQTSEPAAEVWPLGQLVQDVWSARANWPAEQVAQLVRELMSCFPAAQVMHELEPALDWHLPSAQVMHEIDPEARYWPEEHDVQSLDESDPAAEVFPLGQSAHEVRSDRSHVPAEQVEQLVRQPVSCLPAAQVMHELCPVVGWYLPAAQMLHDVLVWLEEDWYCPVSHAEQLSPDA